MTTGDAIMELFHADDVVLRPFEMIHRTGRKPETVRQAIKRLVWKKRLFHLAHSQYARCADTKPFPVAHDRIERLEQRLDALEKAVAMRLACHP